MYVFILSHLTIDIELLIVCSAIYFNILPFFVVFEIILQGKK